MCKDASSSSVFQRLHVKGVNLTGKRRENLNLNGGSVIRMKCWEALLAHVTFEKQHVAQNALCVKHLVEGHLIEFAAVSRCANRHECWGVDGDRRRHAFCACDRAACIGQCFIGRVQRVLRETRYGQPRVVESNACMYALVTGGVD